MARLFLAAGETYGTVGGFVNTDVIGTNANETVFISADADVDFDPSFNRGGDIINIGGLAGIYTATRTGSNLVLTADNGANIVIPVGTVGITINFSGDDSRELVFENGNVLLGDQVITVDGVLVEGEEGPVDENLLFVLTESVVGGLTAARITGDQDVRIDQAGQAPNGYNQIRILDLDGDRNLEINGVENVNPTDLDDDTKFAAFDFYRRDTTNLTNREDNFLGNVYFSGTGNGGDGTSTNGNIYLGGLGFDLVFGGLGNDFLVGGGVAPGATGSVNGNTLVTRDELSGGRNADFFFGDFSTINFTEGATLYVDGGSSTDDAPVGNNGPQDSDWFLLEAQDDEEPLVVDLDYYGGGELGTERGAIFAADTVSQIFAQITEIENIDASGNLYGFLDSVDVSLGQAGKFVDWDGDGVLDENVGIGSSAQLVIYGSVANNILIGGYDNDLIEGQDGNDLLFGGNLKYALQHPNAAGIINDGRDHLYGGSGDDGLVFEADGGIVDGGSGNDTLWLTSQSLGTKTIDQITTDSVLRFDLEADGLESEEQEFGFQTAGYGGADVDGTADQTNYGNGANPADYRVVVEGINNIDASGLGGIDYFAAGSNNPETAFNNQQNHLGADWNLDLRGSNGDNGLFAGGGNDVLEGRKGNDTLQGGAGTDDFYFSIDGDTVVDFGEDGGFGEDFPGSGDGVDAIIRKYDGDDDNLWDVADDAFIAQFGAGTFVRKVSEDGQNVITNRGNRYWDTDGDGKFDLVAFDVAENAANDKVPPVLWGQDFGLDEDQFGNSSFLTIDFGSTNFSDPNVLITNFSIKIGTEVFSVNSADLADVDNAEDIAAIVNARFSQQDAAISVTSVGNTLIITDLEGRNISDTLGEGFVVSFALSNSASEVFAEFSDQPPTIVQDRIIYKAYEDRSDNEGVDDDGITGSTISLGKDAYAQDLVVGFSKDGTRLAEDQFYTLKFGNLTTEDVVTVTVNGVEYTLQVGVDLNGKQIDDEDGVGENQSSVQSAFLGRLADFINSFMDDDTAAGSIWANFDGDDTLTFSQNAYAGEQTVFIHEPTVAIQNLSGGEQAFAVVENISDHEVHLFGFDGRNNNLNEDNVLFWGQEEIQRSVLATAKDDATTVADRTLEGLDALVINGGIDDLVGITNNKATDNELDENFAVHGDDLLIGGNADDIINAKTGDDRVHGSLGNDALDGGNDWYAVRRVGETKYTATVLSAYEAHKLDAQADVLEVVLIRQTQDGEDMLFGTGLTPVPGSAYDAYFSDTLIYQQSDIDQATGAAAGTARFYINLNDFVVEGGQVVFNNGGAGTITVDANGNGNLADDAANVSTFKNFENIRTVSGIKDATAGTDGLGKNQGNDTLDLVLLSDAVDANGGTGVVYDLTNDFDPGAVTLVEKGGSRTVLRVDGVENVIFGKGDDVLNIDETEAAKNNFIDGNLGNDTVNYYNDFSGTDLEPQLTFVVEASADRDLAIFTGGRLGQVVATDTLESIENVGLYYDTAIGSKDVLDVTNVDTGSTVKLYNGEVSVGGNFNTKGTLLVDIENIEQLETIKTGDGNDLILVATSDIMDDNSNAEDNNVDLTFDTFLNYDIINSAFDRQSVGDLRASNPSLIPEVSNFGLFTFDLGAGTADRVDYSQTDDNIVAIVGVQQGTNYVLVDGNTDSDYDDEQDRVDALIGAEQITASNEESVLDFTTLGKDTTITFQFNPSNVVGSEDRLESFIRIADGANNQIAGTATYVEYWDLDKNGAVAPFDNATWNRIEGSDFNEHVIFEGSEDLSTLAGVDHRYSNDEMNLRGGNNTVSYNQLETSITATIQVKAFDDTNTTTALNSGFIAADIEFQDGSGNTGTDPNGNAFGQHFVTSNTADNGIAGGTLKIEASQDAEDTFGLVNSDPATYVLGVSPGVIEVGLGDQGTLLLTGFEILLDDDTDDVYDMRILSAINTNLTLVDNANNDHDLLKVYSDAINFNGVGANTISLSDLNTVFSFDFDVLDLTALTATAAWNPLTTVVGNGDPTDELVLGVVNNIANVTDFTALVLTEATTTAVGTNWVWNTDAGTFTSGAKVITDTSGSVERFGFYGLVREGSYNDGRVAAADTAVSITITGAAAGVEVFGGNGADVIVGAGQGYTFTGGEGADILDGGVTPEKVVVTLPGGAASLDAGEILTVAGVTVGDAGQTITVVAGADADQVGSAFAAYAAGAGNLAIIEANLGLNPGDLTSVTYDSLSNNIIFNFSAQAGDVAGGVVTASVSAGDLTPTVYEDGTDANGQSIGFAGENNDVFQYFAATESTLSGFDTIRNFDINNGADDLLDFSEFALNGANHAVNNSVQTFASLQTLATSALAGDAADIFVGRTDTDAYVFVDTDNNNTFDMVIKLEGVTSVADFDSNNYTF